MEGIDLRFNADVEKLRQLGIDPTTSEGKATLQQFLLRALWDASLGKYEGRDAEVAGILLNDI